MKKYVDANEIIKPTIELPSDLWEFEELMREKPNFNKSQGARLIYTRNEYAVYQVKKGYIIHNRKVAFKNGHTHVFKYKKAISLIDLAVRKKLPDTPRKWEIECLLRIVRDKNYINKLNNLI